jgi:hypothetical protein
MTALLFLAFVFFLGPLALWFGADSRDRDPDDMRGWWPAAPRPTLEDFGSTSTPTSVDGHGVWAPADPAHACRRETETEALLRPI